MIQDYLGLDETKIPSGIKKFRKINLNDFSQICMILSYIVGVE